MPFAELLNIQHVNFYQTKLEYLKVMLLNFFKLRINIFSKIHLNYSSECLIKSLVLIRLCRKTKLLLIFLVKV